MSKPSTAPGASLWVVFIVFLLSTAYAWYGQAMTKCDGVEFCGTGYVHAFYTAAAYAMTAASIVLLICISIQFVRR
ncbi:hypothetical protein [Burkholderia gladioli]|uniref:hypothetical protein n=1 Tax=Burkholderia gladioli TaxID=28095 RepID=UPI002FE10F83